MFSSKDELLPKYLMYLCGVNEKCNNLKNKVMGKINLRISEMMRFENFLWSHHNPAEVLEEWADKATKSVYNLSADCCLDPYGIVLPLSDAVDDYVRFAHEWFRTPLTERSGGEFNNDFYPGAELTEEELRWVAVHMQNALIPAY